MPRRALPSATGRKTGVRAAVLAVMLVLSACTNSQEDAGGGASTADAAPAAVEGPATTAEADGVILEVTVGPEREDCVGSAPMRCLVVDGELFYDPIEGFEHQEGYEYQLKIEQYDAWPGQEPPQDAGRYGYRLIEMISKEQTPDAAPATTAEAGGMILEVTVGPEREDCVGSAPMRCLVVDGELFYDPIEGFEHQEGYEYQLKIEQYDAWPGQEPPQDAGRYGYRLIEMISKQRAAQQ